MSALRELLAYDISHGDMTQSDTEETGADRIGAMARSDPLGAALWRVTGNLDVGAFITARGYLVARLHAKMPGTFPRLTEAVAQKAMEEWLACLCHTCGGHKFIVNPSNGVRETCTECRGSGRGRHSDEERMRCLGVGPGAYSKIVDVFAQAHKMLNAADSMVESQIAFQLERKKSKPMKSKV